MASMHVSRMGLLTIMCLILAGTISLAYGEEARMFSPSAPYELKAGRLEITGEVGAQQPLFNGTALRPESDAFEFVQGFNVQDTQVVLLLEFTEGADCPNKYYFLEFRPTGEWTSSEAFGTCTDDAQGVLLSDVVAVVMGAGSVERTFYFKNGRLLTK